MPGFSNTLLIEGSFYELAEELAQYLDTLQKTDGANTITSEISPQLTSIRQLESDDQPPNDAQKAQIIKEREAILGVLVPRSSVLNTAPEKELLAAYNLLIHLMYQVPKFENHLARLCKFLSEPFPISSQFGPSLQVTILTTLFNTISSSNPVRYRVFMVLLEVVQKTSNSAAFEALKPQLNTNMPKWLGAWALDSEDTQHLYEEIADVAQSFGDLNMSYEYLLKALEVIPPSEASSEDSQELASRILKAAFSNPSVYDFTPLTASDSIQALRKSDPSLFELLEILAGDDYSTYQDFLETNSLDSLSLSSASSVIDTKMRLLTLASLAAASSNRSVPYSHISSSLQVPREDVEMWVIDTIRAGLVEGKLSQLKGEFLVQRATYRVFGEKQWTEIQGRLMVWRRSLEGVLGVIRTEKEKYLREGLTQDGQANGYSGGGDRRQPRGQRMQTRDMDFGGD
ncbi:MAG: hypothetical protein Q9227_006023 [Pyrenula ochraceoflavens]